MRAFVSPPCNWAEKMEEIRQAMNKRIAAEKAKDEPRTRQCPSCAAVYIVTQDWDCPGCGEV